MVMKTNTANIYISAKDETKQALGSITSNIRGVVGVLGTLAAAAGGISAVNTSLQKFASLSTFQEFGLAAEEALGYVDALQLAGMSQDQVAKSFSDLSTKIQDGLNDEEIQKTFERMGVSLDDLKNKSEADIFKTVLDTLSKAENKVQALADAKAIFGKQGLVLLEGSQEERFQRVLDRTERFKEEIRLANFESDELYKNFDEIKNIITNKIATAIGPLLVPLNALLQTFIDTTDEADKTKEKVDAIGKSDAFKNLIVDAFDFADVIYATFKKFGEISGGVISLVAGAFLKLIPAINLVGDAIFGGIVKTIQGGISSVGDLAKSFKYFIDGQWWMAQQTAKRAFSLGENFEAYKKKLNQDAQEFKTGLGSQTITASLDVIFSPLKTGNFEAEKQKFLQNYEKEIKKVQEDIAKPRKSLVEPRTATKDKKEDKPKADKKDRLFGIVELTDVLLKQLDAELQAGKDSIDFLEKYNELQYDANLKTIEDYYKQKIELSKTDFEFQKSILLQEQALVQENLGKAKTDEEKVKLKEKLASISVKLNKIDKDYLLESMELENKSYQEIFKNAVSKIELSQRFKDKEIERLQLTTELTGLSIADEEKLKQLTEEKVALIQQEIDKLKEKKNITQEEQLNIQEKELEIIKIRTDEQKKLADNKFKELDVSKQLNQLEIEKLKFNTETFGNVFENNLKMKKLKEEEIALLEKEIALLTKKENKSASEKKDIEEKKEKVRQLKLTTDEIAMGINKTIEDNLTNAFSSIIDGTKSVKDAFKDMANSIVDTIQKQIIDGAVKNLMSNLTGATGQTSGGIGGFLSGLFGGGSGGFDLMNFISGAFASGGYAHQNQAYLVGERGPELFIPSNSGRVINNRQSAEMMGTSNNVVINIQASDVNSFRNSEAQIAASIQKAISRGNKIR